MNLSSKQFAQPDLIDRVEQILAETGLDPSCLRLEITESAIMDQADAALAKLSPAAATSGSALASTTSAPATRR